MSIVVEKNKIRKRDILDAFINKEFLTLSELTRITGISLPVVTKLVYELIEEKLITEHSEKSSSASGRPANQYTLNAGFGYIIGIDLGRLNSRIALLDLSRNILHQKNLKRSFLSQDTHLVHELLTEVKQFSEEHSIPWRSVLSVGIALPGIIQRELGISQTYLLSGKEPLSEYLSNLFDKPVIIENDVKAMSHGELYDGGAKDFDYVLCLNYGWGLGVGMIMNGNIFYGRDGFAGEFGHIPINREGELCYCGKKGCLETISSGKYLVDKAKVMLGEGAPSLLKKHYTVDEIGIEEILSAASSGDQFSIEMLEEAGKNLGAGIAMLINLFNPQKIIVGGDMAFVAQYILETIRTNALKHSLVQLNHNIIFEISALGSNAALLGVSWLALKEYIYS